MDMHGVDDLAQLHEQVLHHRLWHWFVAGTHGVMDGWQLPALRVAMASWCDDVDMTDALVAFAAPQRRGDTGPPLRWRSAAAGARSLQADDAAMTLPMKRHPAHRARSLSLHLPC
jgi:hypothetical protein